MSWISNILQKVLQTGGGMIWNKVFSKFLKAFVIALAIAILMGMLGALQTFIPDGMVGQAIWAAIGPALIGLVTAAINMLKHYKDKPPEDNKSK